MNRELLGYNNNLYYLNPSLARHIGELRKNINYKVVPSNTLINEVLRLDEKDPPPKVFMKPMQS